MKAVLFDLDGTLLDSIEGIVSSFVHALDLHLPGHGITRATMLSRIGEPLPVQMLGFARGDAVKAEVLTAAYRDHNYGIVGGMPLYPHVKRVLVELKRRGFSLGLVTSKTRRSAALSLTAHSLEDELGLIMTTDDTPKHKPDPMPLLVAAERLGIANKDIAYVGDSTFDMLCAKRAGSFAIAALWGPFSRAELEMTHPDRFIERVEQLLDLPELATPR